MINKIERKENPELFQKLAEGVDDIINKEHRKYSSFYCNALILIDEECFPEEEFKPYYGTWMSNDIIWSDAEGYDSGDIDSLVRVEKKTRTIVEEYWDVVK